ncbi:hypothetical protein RM423_11295 [Jatrophihabitans sp. DSM 44399]|uniref:Phosphotyrosine protein phosphatase I domain-containing protein n=2 Tax=Jatrophihabitans lederbergiae TaxID=3075547 RepID=A0ABU2JAJ6_9ACTN|nr:hypothetical protein [Jatrophihabitans sp. DSM 44399]MDT0261982.1 hypothetical protein [Jatrophihabitans sp. DSM 44399]
MSDVVYERPANLDGPVLAKLSTLDRFLPVWIITAMAVGIGLGRAVPSLAGDLDSVKVGSISLSIALGLLLMMYPVLAKVRYNQLGRVTGDRRLLAGSLLLNWIVGPALMFTLAWLLLPDLPAYRTGLIVVGLARCIAMVLIWNELACGDRDAAAVLVAINSVFQILAFAALGWFYLQVLPHWLGFSTTSAHFSVVAIALSVLVFLGIPLVAGYLTRALGERAKGRDWYEGRLLPHRTGRTVRAAVHHRGAVRAAGAYDHQSTLGRRPDRASAAGVLRAHVLRGVCLGSSTETGLCQDHHTGLHRRRKQLRAGHRRGDRDLRGHVRPGPGGCRGSAHRGTGPGRAGLRGVVDPPPLVSGRISGSRPAGGTLMTGKPSVLFVCVHNAGRSQMAQGWLHHLAGDRIEVRSAGSEPAERINPSAIAVMAEVGIDITAEQPKILTVGAVRDSDAVITMGCGDTCPIFPGKRYEDWDLPDPAGRSVEDVRPIRDEIRARVQSLVDELLGR